MEPTEAALEAAAKAMYEGWKPDPIFEMQKQGWSNLPPAARAVWISRATPIIRAAFTAVPDPTVWGDGLFDRFQHTSYAGTMQYLSDDLRAFMGREA